MKIIFQTDNGSEFIGSVRKDIKKRSFFEKVLENNNIEYRRIPPRSPTFNSDIEAFHKIIEDEFYECERFDDQDDFFAKSYAYLLFFNYERENTNKDNKSPYQLLKEKEPNLCDKILNLLPIRLEWLAERWKVVIIKVYTMYLYCSNLIKGIIILTRRCGRCEALECGY